MKKIIKKYGNSNVIILTAEDMKIERLKVGNIIDVQIKKEDNKK